MLLKLLANAHLFILVQDMRANEVRGLGKGQDPILAAFSPAWSGETGFGGSLSLWRLELGRAVSREEDCFFLEKSSVEPKKEPTSVHKCSG